MYLVNFIDSISSSDTIFYVLMILLTIISAILFFLIYTQNKEMSRKMKEKSLFEDEDIAKVEDTSSPVTEVENLVAEKPQLVPVTDMEIPDLLELTQSFNVIPDKTLSEAKELQSITKELETLPRERKIEMTPYETEQEETAIISYDELIKHKDDKVAEQHNAEESTNKTEDLIGSIREDKEIDEMNNSYFSEDGEKGENAKEKIVQSEENEKNNNLDYEHEEKFLGSLKALLKMLKS